MIFPTKTNNIKPTVRPKGILSAICLFAMWLLCFSATYGATMDDKVTLANERPELYLPMLQGKKTAILSNHTGIDHDSIHTLDKLLAHGVDITMIFSPEHGFRGNADAGAKVSSSVDPDTGLPIVSLYGGKQDPFTRQRMDSIEIFVVDIQDVGLRFYTYYISMMKIMEQAAKTGKKVIVLDRPNPNGMTVDGPILDMSLKSGVGRIPIPVLHGMTLGELALMINGEGWLDGGLKCDLAVVPMKGYSHDLRFNLLNMPSPNLKSMHAIYLYPSTCLFEGTPLSLGRGTQWPFEVYGHPNLTSGNFHFTPHAMKGAANPPLKNQKCRGTDLRTIPDEDIIAKGMDLGYVIEAYNSYPDKDKFFTSFFDKLIGSKDVSKRIRAGENSERIKESWKEGIDRFKEKRAGYLLYP